LEWEVGNTRSLIKIIFLVPIMLAYVYGVVPLSLCRNGGCGGSTESTTLEDLVEDEEELGNVTAGLRG
jgi:hypothetical protein